MSGIVGWWRRTIAFAKAVRELGAQRRALDATLRDGKELLSNTRAANRAATSAFSEQLRAAESQLRAAKMHAAQSVGCVCVCVCVCVVCGSECVCCVAVGVLSLSLSLFPLVLLNRFSVVM
jgi:hypothetical protein